MLTCPNNDNKISLWKETGLEEIIGCNNVATVVTVGFEFADEKDVVDTTGSHSQNNSYQ